jgi:membrane complex biogenesis BtpA family protein
MKFSELFTSGKPLIACIHLQSLPGSPGYEGSMKKIIESALEEATLFSKYGIDGLIIENFRDHPFYPDALPAETIAAMTAVSCEVVKVFPGPVGINALRNDARAALAVATASGAHFIRVNIHIGAAVTDQGIIQGKAHETLRLRKILNNNILIFVDVAVKHASSLGNRNIVDETKDLTTRGMADAIIVTGSQTGGQADPEEIIKVRKNTELPVIIGSGITESNINDYFDLADGFIVGSFLKKNGKADNFVEEKRVKMFDSTFQALNNRKQ